MAGEAYAGRYARALLDILKPEDAEAAEGEHRRAGDARRRSRPGRGVQAEFREDPALLGGARLRIGSTIYDGSVRGRLEALREQLAAR